jgi:PAS domain S-box-containing protein
LRQFGYTTVEELLGKKIEVLIPRRFKEKHEKYRHNYQAANAHSRPMGSGMDLFGIKKDNTEFPVEVCLSPYQTPDGQFVIAFISDITIRKESELALIRLNEELEDKVEQRTKSLSEALEKEKDLNELKSRFVSMASHEFRTPLSTIMSSSFIASKYTTTEDQPQRERHHQIIAGCVNTLTDTLNDFLLLGKIEEGKMQTRFADQSIPELINATIVEIQGILKDEQQLIYNHEGDERFFIDSTLLKHIITNLASNAIKFSPEKADIRIFTKIANDELRLTVCDNGMGISKEDQQHLFERFFRGKNVTNIEGTGLGLHIVAKYAELMHGTIECKSELNEGTEFIITLKRQN